LSQWRPYEVEHGRLRLLRRRRILRSRNVLRRGYPVKANLHRLFIRRKGRLVWKHRLEALTPFADTVAGSLQRAEGKGLFACGKLVIQPEYQRKDISYNDGKKTLPS